MDIRTEDRIKLRSVAGGTLSTGDRIQDALARILQEVVDSIEVIEAEGVEDV